MLQHFLFKKLHNRNVVTLNVLPPRSLHRSLRMFHCWKQCCRPSSDSLFMSSVAFVFTASTDSNLVPFDANLIFGNKESHMGLCQVSTVDVPTRWSCASSKRLYRLGVVCRRVVLLKNPWAVLLHYRSSPHPFTKVCHNLLVVDLVNSLTFRHPVHVNSPSDVEKMIIIALNLDLLCRAFFWLGELGFFQCMDWRLLSGSYWKNHGSSQVITFSKKVLVFSMFEEYQH